MTIYQGFTWDITPAEKLQNELAAVRDILTENPLNDYWFNRLLDLQTKAEIANDTAWLADAEADAADYADLKATEQGALNY